MKKYLLLLLCTITVGLSSCKKETFINETTNRTVLVDIPPGNWALSANGLYYSTVVDLPENNSNFNHVGQVLVAMSFDNPDVYEALPQVYAGDSYTFTSQPGKVTIFINDAYNNARPVPPSGVTTAKVTLVDAYQID